MYTFVVSYNRIAKCDAPKGVAVYATHLLYCTYTLHRSTARSAAHTIPSSTTQAFYHQVDLVLTSYLGREIQFVPVTTTVLSI